MSCIAGSQWSGDTSQTHLGVQQTGNTELSLGKTEGEAVVLQNVLGVEAVVVNELRSKVVEDGTEGEAGPEGPGHVLDPDVVVAGHHSPYPDLNGL